jgi:hypothetical protein
MLKLISIRLIDELCRRNGDNNDSILPIISRKNVNRCVLLWHSTGNKTRNIEMSNMSCVESFNGIRFEKKNNNASRKRAHRSMATSRWTSIVLSKHAHCWQVEAFDVFFHTFDWENHDQHGLFVSFYYLFKRKRKFVIMYLCTNCKRNENTQRRIEETERE